MDESREGREKGELTIEAVVATCERIQPDQGEVSLNLGRTSSDLLAADEVEEDGRRRKARSSPRRDLAARQRRQRQDPLDCPSLP